jgi:cytosine/adenosine deaminase-related metal-dependent hydrolase
VDEPVAFRARWVLPVDGPPLADGVVTLQGSRIVRVGRNTSSSTPRDLGLAAILPGLVNAHTHLEFSDLRSPLGDPATSFPDWIERVVAYRRSTLQRPDAAAIRAAAVTDGLGESLRGGTTLLADIATEPWSVAPLLGSPVRGVVFQEILGLGPERVEPLLDTARRRVAEFASRAPDAEAFPGGWSFGLSPHAPYTVHFELLRELVALSAETRVPLAMHLAETPEELELLRSHSGPLVEQLQRFDAWYPGSIPRGIEPRDYLDVLSGAHRVLVVHGNYLSSGEMEMLAAFRDKMSVVYCPRTHARFGHRHYPLPDLLRAGARVALGTDSRASNPDLSLYEELRFAMDRFPEVEAADLLRMATLHGAEALGMADHCGSIAPGKRADLVVVSLSSEHADDPYGFLRDASARVQDVVCAGNFAHLA